MCSVPLSPPVVRARHACRKRSSRTVNRAQGKTGMFEVPPLCENESDDAPNGSYDLISSFGTYTNQKPHRVSLKKLGWINGVNPLL